MLFIVISIIIKLSLDINLVYESGYRFNQWIIDRNITLNQKKKKIMKISLRNHNINM